MRQELAKAQEALPVLSPEIIQSLVINGDLSKLSATDKVKYYNTLCERIGLDPATQPFKLLTLNNKQVLYADKGAAQQLCKIYDISTEITERRTENEVYVVTTRAKLPAGRYTDEDGAVSIAGLKGDSLANALMKASTKSKRRAVLALCGLGMLDETEIETIPNAKVAEIIEPIHPENGNGKPEIKSDDRTKKIDEIKGFAKEIFKTKSDFEIWLKAGFNQAKLEDLGNGILDIALNRLLDMKASK